MNIVYWEKNVWQDKDGDDVSQSGQDEGEQDSDLSLVKVKRRRSIDSFRFRLTFMFLACHWNVLGNWGRKSSCQEG